MQPHSLPATELTAWLTRTTQTIDRSLRDQARREVVAELFPDLREIPAPLSVLAQLALLDDCLRVTALADAPLMPEELARIGELVHIAASKYFTILPLYESFGEGASTPREVERFLELYRGDAGPFGYGGERAWRGVALVLRVEQVTHNAAPRRDHERMLARVLDVVFAGSATDAAADARRSLRDRFAPPPSEGPDPRALAFCRADGPEVFTSVAHGSQIHVRDPFDVESIHAEARAVFHRLVDRATTPAQHVLGHGRTLLILGESGSGKTHLLRALRYQLHSQRRGFAGYLQMSSEVGDYARYVLRNFIDSLERPYDAPTLTESALLYLSNGLAEGNVEHPAAELEALRRREDLEGEALHGLVSGMVDRLLRHEQLEALEPDLLHALLLLQRRDAAIQRRVIQFLRCESLTAHEQRLLGGLAPRLQPDDPMRTLKHLGAIAFELQLAATVLLVDQVEDTLPDPSNVVRLQQAFDVLRNLADAIPSSVVVISCLDDVYSSVRPRLSQSLRDRIEQEPRPLRLAHQRQRIEIEEMLIRRLDHLYSSFDVGWNEDEPLYPFSDAQLAAVTNFRTRDCLAEMYRFHQACIVAGELVPPSAMPAAQAAPPLDDAALARLDQLWNDARVAGGIEFDESDHGLLALVAEALQEASIELGLELRIQHGARADVPQLVVEAAALPRRVLEVCNRAPQGGHLAVQLDELTRAAVAAQVRPVALRRSDFEFGPRTLINRRVGELRAADGLPVVLEDAELRAIVAARTLAHAKVPKFAAWKLARRPIAELALVRGILDLDGVRSVDAPRAGGKLARGTTINGVVDEALARAPAPASAPSAEVEADGVDTSLVREPRPRPLTEEPSLAPPRPSAPPRRSSTAGAEPQLLLGVTTSMRAEPVRLPLEQLKTHVAILGSTGSGKTTAALSIIEQALDAGVSALLVDRKGDLARYASEAWWAEDERRRALRAKIDVALFTPGNDHGRPLRLPLVTPLFEASSQDRDQLATFGAGGLAAMMGYGRGAANGHKQSVLKCAIQLCADQPEITLELIHSCVSSPDPELLSSVGALKRFFAPLAEDLQSLIIQRGALLTGTGELLALEELLPPPDAPRPRLTILNTAALGDGPLLQFWMSRLLVELDRLIARRPRAELQALAFLDEADLYLPAVGQPPTKAPMFSLLRRARARGLGVMLATQSPGDLDYKARDNILTWLVGKVTQERAVDKMRALLADYPNVATRLANQPQGHFFLLGGTYAAGAVEVKLDRAMMETATLSEAEVAELARAGRP